MTRWRVSIPFVLAVLALAATPAMAGVKSPPLHMYTGVVVTEGNGVLDLNLTWKRKDRQVFAKGRLDDVCPGDGYVVRMDVFYLTAVDGWKTGYSTWTTGKCKKPSQRIKFAMGRYDGPPLLGVRVNLYETDSPLYLRHIGDQTFQYVAPPDAKR